MDVLTHLNWLNKVQEIIRIQSVYAQKKKKKKNLTIRRVGRVGVLQLHLN